VWEPLMVKTQTFKTAIEAGEVKMRGGGGLSDESVAGGGAYSTRDHEGGSYIGIGFGCVLQQVHYSKTVRRVWNADSALPIDSEQ
jgi:hypothetical protein